jgi:hypothetical protein
MSSVQHLSLDSILRAVRDKVCVTCYQRPPGSEKLPNGVARSCEGKCPIFYHLPALYRIAVHDDSPAPGAIEQAIRGRICRHCSLAPTAGEECAEFSSRTCPLSRYGADVVGVIETLRDWQRHPHG